MTDDYITSNSHSRGREIACPNTSELKKWGVQWKTYREETQKLFSDWPALGKMDTKIF